MEKKMPPDRSFRARRPACRLQRVGILRTEPAMRARFIAIVALTAAAAASAQPAPPVRTGGIGEEERRALESDTRYNLKLVAADRAGQYIADVDVTIVDERGQQVVAERMAGPWLLADLPPGRYRVLAVYEGASRSRDVVVGRGGRQEIVMHWDARGSQ
jgi:hypothetical protein